MSGFLALAATADGWIGNWSPGIGDPTPAGWLATVAYVVAAWCCFDAGRGLSPLLQRERVVWRVLAAALAVLAVNKQLDLQVAFTEIAKWLARSGGWYEQRRPVQTLFVVAFALTAAGATLVGLHFAWRESRALRLAVAAFGALLGYVAARVAYFQHLDIAISHEWLGLRASSLLELAALLVLIAAARWRSGSRA